MKRRSNMFLLILMLSLLVVGLNANNDRVFVEVTSPDTIYKLEEGVIYFGRNSCEACKEAEKILKSILNENKLKLYYFDTDKMRSETDFEKILVKYSITEVPTLIKIKNGRSENKISLVSKSDFLDKETITKFILK